MANISVYHCNECKEVLKDGESVIGCSACSRWDHRKCVYMSSLSKKDIGKCNWVCTPCLQKLRFLNSKEGSFLKKLDVVMEKINEVNSKVDQAQVTLTNVQKIAEQPSSMLSASVSTPPPVSYASATKKNLLVVKSTVDTMKAMQKKNEISNALQDFQIVNTKFKTNNGNIILNFENQEQRDRAAEEVEKLENLSAVRTKKLLPKIMICNVNIEESREDLVDTMIQKNDYLQNIEDIKNKINLVFVKDAAGGTKHYILKCHPEVRGLIYRHGDEIKLA